MFVTWLGFLFVCFHFYFSYLLLLLLSLFIYLFIFFYLIIFFGGGGPNIQQYSTVRAKHGLFKNISGNGLMHRILLDAPIGKII